jgi:hypothetical protein
VNGKPKSYFSPALVYRDLPHKGFYGVFARTSIPAGTLLVMWGGEITPADQLAVLEPLLISRSVQVEEDLYLVPAQVEPCDFINHSCNPNAGLSGQIALVALRDIHPGEEVCYDYAMTDGSPYDEFTCQCGEPTCRGRVSGHDWMRPDLQARYQGYFSPYLQRRIDRLALAPQFEGARY